jgi:Tfp pilus assembly protein PilN
MDDNKLVIEHPFITEDSTPLLRGESTGAKKTLIAALDWRQQAGTLLFIVGLITLFVGWFQVSGTRDTSDQLTYMVGGGVFGLALLALGAVCFMASEHKNDRQAIAALSERIVLLEHGLAGEFDALDGTLQSLVREARGSRVD